MDSLASVAAELMGARSKLSELEAAVAEADAELKGTGRTYAERASILQNDKLRLVEVERTVATLLEKQVLLMKTGLSACVSPFPQNHASECPSV